MRGIFVCVSQVCITYLSRPVRECQTVRVTVPELPEALEQEQGREPLQACWLPSYGERPSFS